jgi:hypothetical protein
VDRSARSGGLPLPHGDGASLEVDLAPRERNDLAAAHPGCGGDKDRSAYGVEEAALTSVRISAASGIRRLARSTRGGETPAAGFTASSCQRTA